MHIAMKSSILVFFIVALSLPSSGQKRTCQSLHTGTFKSISKEFGTTMINLTKTLQVEENDDRGYKLAYDITWTSQCTYELRLKQVIKGNPSLLEEKRYVIKVQITEIKESSYIAESSSTAADNISRYEIIIVK